MRRHRRFREKILAAIRHLAVAEGDVRRRLRGAFRYLRMLNKDEIPDQFRDEWAAILRALTCRGPEIDSDDEFVHKNAVDHTLARMKNGAGRKIAERIFALYRATDC